MSLENFKFSNDFILLTFSFTNLISSCVLLTCVNISESMTVNGSNSSQVGHKDKVRNLNDIQQSNINGLHLMGGTRDINIPLAHGNVVFQITSIMLQLLKLKGLFNGLAHEYPHEHL